MPQIGRSTVFHMTIFSIHAYVIKKKLSDQLHLPHK